MDQLEQEYGRVYCDIRKSTNEDIKRCFEAELSHFSSCLMDKITTQRDEMRQRCESRRLELTNLAMNVNFSLEELPEVVPPYETLLEVLDQRSKEVVEIAKERQDKINRYFGEAAEIAHAIGFPLPLKPENLHIPTIDTLKRTLMKLRAERKHRLKKIGDLQDQILALYQELGHQGAATGLSNDPLMDLTDSQLQALKKEVHGLRVLKDRRQADSDTLKKEIATYAEYLKRNINFTSQLSQCYLEGLVRTRDDLLMEFRNTISERICILTEEYEAKCRALFIEPVVFTGDSTLETYESILQENKKLDGLLSMRGYIDKAYQEYKSLLDDERLLEEAAKNPNRFKERGSVLLEENKRRNRVASRKPMVMKRILTWVSDWKTKLYKPFLVEDGQDLKTVVETDAAKNSRKPSVRAARAAMDTINSKAPKPTIKKTKRLIVRPATNAAKRPVRPAISTRAISAGTLSRPSGANPPEVIKSSQKSENGHIVPEKEGSRVSRATQAPEKPSSSGSHPALRPLVNNMTPKPTTLMKTTNVTAQYTLAPENVSTLDSRMTPCTPSVEGKREYQCCDNLTYKLKRTVEIPNFDPDFSLLEFDRSAHHSSWKANGDKA